MLMARWLWARRTLPARLVRLALLPPSLMYRAVMAARARAYAGRLFPQGVPSVPTIAVGNLTVGGSGKTPIAAWIARYYAGHGLVPGVVLRGYGGDEGDVHRVLVREAVVVENPDRLEGAAQAVRDGAEVIVLDDAFQRLDVGRDLNIAVMSAESGRAVRWTLPAGPWREGWRALKRADLLVITRKRAGLDDALQLARRAARFAPGAGVAIARLGITEFRRLLSGKPVAPDAFLGARVVAAAGIADPATFGAQCREMGARVRLIQWRDHHRLSADDVRRLLQAVGTVDYVVLTEKDAVKLRRLWPVQAPEPLVATLDVRWERGQALVERALDAAVSDVDELLSNGDAHDGPKGSQTRTHD
jgi:tetraacyldisaccharide 4'-kinase